MKYGWWIFYVRGRRKKYISNQFGMGVSFYTRAWCLLVLWIAWWRIKKNFLFSSEKDFFMQFPVVFLMLCSLSHGGHIYSGNGKGWNSTNERTKKFCKYGCPTKYHSTRRDHCCGNTCPNSRQCRRTTRLDRHRFSYWSTANWKHGWRTYINSSRALTRGIQTKDTRVSYPLKPVKRSRRWSILACTNIIPSSKGLETASRARYSTREGHPSCMALITVHEAHELLGLILSGAPP